MVSKSGRITNFSKEEKLLMAALGREFPETKVQRIRQQNGANIQLLKSKRYQTGNESDLRMPEGAETPIQERT